MLCVRKKSVRTKPVFLNITLIHMHLCPYVRSIILLYGWSIMLSNIIYGSYLLSILFLFLFFIFRSFAFFSRSQTIIIGIALVPCTSFNIKCKNINACELTLS
jgi:hypothetical protein